MINPVIAVRNNSGGAVKDSEIPDALRVLQYQVNYQFSPHWNATCVLQPFGKQDKIPPKAWLLEILGENPDSEKEAGFHLPGPTPQLKVFAKTAEAGGRPWTATASHEILEALANPWAAWCWQVRVKGQDGALVRFEVCDPVDDSRYQCRVGTVQAAVSNFVLPNWFRPESSKNYDYLGKCKEPLEVLVNGSMSTWNNGRWRRIGRVASGDQGPRPPTEEALADFLYDLVMDRSKLKEYLQDKTAALANSGLTEDQQKVLRRRNHKQFARELGRGLSDGDGGKETLMPSLVGIDDD